jgi:hypothetical protein
MNQFMQIAMWIMWHEDGTYSPMCKVFQDGELGAALKFTESLRRAKFTKEPVVDEQTGEVYGTEVTHITISGDTPGNVTKMGVATVNADYNWKKRRV